MKGPSLTVEESVRLEAYLLSERAGHPHGMDAVFWTQAEAIVHGRTAAIAPSVVAKPAKAPARKTAAKKPPAPAAKVEDQLPLVPEVPKAAKTVKAPAKKKAAAAKPEAKASVKRVAKAK